MLPFSRGVHTLTGGWPFVAMAMLVAGATVAGFSTDAVGAAESEHGLVVAGDGSGDFVTIGEALAGAADGDHVLVRPGTYDEAITIDRAVAVEGDGPRAEIVISGGGSTPVVTLAASGAMLSGVTLRGPESYVHVVDGSTTLSDIHLDQVGSGVGVERTCHALFGPSSCNAVAVRIDGGVAMIRDSAFDGPGAVNVHGGATALIEGNAMAGGAHVFLEAPSDDTIVRGNHISDPVPAGIALYSTGRPLIEGNTIEGSAAAGIAVGVLRQAGIEPVIRGNVVRDNATGIEATPGAEPTIEGNELRGNTTAIVLPGSDGLVADNLIIDNATGVFLMQGAPTIRGNTISGSSVGLGLGSDGAVPILQGNIICDNETNVNLVFGALMPDISGNEICP